MLSSIQFHHLQKVFELITQSYQKNTKLLKIVSLFKRLKQEVKMVSETENGSNGEITNGNSTVPEWLNEEYFKDILDKEFGKHEITKFSAESATGKGENYASRMTRVLIDLQLEGEI